MSVIHINNITNEDGTSGPTISGISTVNSSGFMRVPVGDTFKRNEITNNILDGYVTSELVLYYDPANLNTYPNTGSTIFDLSGENSNGTVSLNAFNTNNGYFNFYGQDKITVEKTTADFGMNSNGGATISIWINPGNQSTWRGLIGFFPPLVYDGTPEFGIDINPAYRIRIWKNSGDYEVYDISENNWIMLTLVSNQSGLYLYANKDLVNTQSNTGVVVNNSNNLLIADHWDPNFIGKIGIISMYKRGLSANDVLKNYNATKYRYEN
jgi:hypothetical protein